MPARLFASKAAQRTIAKSVRRSEQEWEKREAKYPWRSFLTAEEREILKRADAAKAEWLRLNEARAGIQNRAIQRAKYAAERGDQR